MLPILALRNYCSDRSAVVGDHPREASAHWTEQAQNRINGKISTSSVENQLRAGGLALRALYALVKISN